jgi:threonine dehydratase
MRNVKMPTDRDFERARVAVRQHLRPTPLLPLPGNRWLKLEAQQPSGAFKVRGAIAALSRLPKGTRIVTASAGNHAIGVAWAAATLGQQATIVVPANASPRKLDILHDMGANVVPIGESYDDAEAHALELASQGLMYVSPYNDPHVIAGQGTIIDELLPEFKGDFTVVVPVGGGGLISGIAMRAAAIKDRTIHIIGVEAAASLAVSTAVAAGHVVQVEVEDTLADGLAGNLEPGSITVDILAKLDPTFMSVEETEIIAAIRRLYHDHDLVAEGAAATSFAGMQAIRMNMPVVALLTGRNIARDVLAGIVGGS